jgi:hypothetical protein
MPPETVTMHLRVPPSLLAWMKAEAAKHRRSVAAHTLVLLEEARDRLYPAPVPMPPTERAPRQASSTVGPPAKPSQDYVTLYQTIQHVLATQGIEAPDGPPRQIVEARKVRAAFVGARPGNSNSSNKAFDKHMKRMVDGKVVMRDDDKHMIWLAPT